MIKLYDVSLDDEVVEAVASVLTSRQLAQGPEVALLEQRYAKYCEVDHTVAVNSGTAALHTALYALGVGPGDEVVVPAFSFVATANAVLMMGAEPVFADIDPVTYNLSPKSVESLVNSRTKAVIGVNLYGLPAQWQELQELAQAYRLSLVEDAAQSVGAKYNGLTSGGLADIGCFSFYATKNMMSGEGGMLTTNTSYLADRARLFRHHGQDANRTYTYRDLGYNYRMMEMQAVILRYQLKKVEKENKQRGKNAKLYEKLLSDIVSIKKPLIPEKLVHVFHQYTIRVTRAFPLSRHQLQEHLTGKGVQTGVYYPKPLYRAHHLAKYKRSSRYLTHTEKACREVLSLPIHPNLSISDIKRVSEVIHQVNK